MKLCMEYLLIDIFKSVGEIFDIFRSGEDMADFFNLQGKLEPRTLKTMVALIFTKRKCF